MDNKEKRVPLYDRLPEIYRIKDAEQDPPGQLQHYLAIIEDAFAEIHRDIEALYGDLFIDSCADWVIPYIGDLLGVSHIKGDPRTLRADVADAILLRRRKGTLAGLERLTYDLTCWAVHCRELWENLAWNQHLNHQRPDRGGIPPYGRDAQPPINPYTPIRGGTIPVRDPASLSLIGTPFDPFAHLADVKPGDCRIPRYNLPNLAVFLWRLKDYRITESAPSDLRFMTVGGQPLVRFSVDPLGRNLQLFNSYHFDADREPPVVSELDETPDPIVPERLEGRSPTAEPDKYVRIETYDPSDPDHRPYSISEHSLQLHLPFSVFRSVTGWNIRAADLEHWATGLVPALTSKDVVIDPLRGRIIVCPEHALSADDRIAVREQLRLTFTYGAAGPVGAQPVSREPLPEEWRAADTIVVEWNRDPDGLLKALTDLQSRERPLVVEIRDSMIHDLDPSQITGTILERTVNSLCLVQPLIIRAADGERPIIRLAGPLGFRPERMANAASSEEEKRLLKAEHDRLTVRLQGLFITRAPGFPIALPLIARAALNRLEIIDCTLDPLPATPETAARPLTVIRLDGEYGFEREADARFFTQIPEISLKRTLGGPLAVDPDYLIRIAESVIDAGGGTGIRENDCGFVLTGTVGPPDRSWGPETEVHGATFFGRMRVTKTRGEGAIWVHSLQVLDQNHGCLKYCYFSDDRDNPATQKNILPQNHGCVNGRDARLSFTSEYFGDPGYAQIRLQSDQAIRERGPNDDAMGAFGFLLEAHKWRNLSVRYREFLPAGIRPIFIPVT